MVIPDTFGLRGEKPVASYDFFDLATNQASKVFYASRNNNKTVDMLSPVEIGSDITFTLISVAGAHEEVNYDYEFGLPMVIGGDFFISGTVQVNRTAGTVTGHTDFRILKVTLASAEEELVGTISFTPQSNGGVASVCDSYTIAGSIPKTHFKAGEKLRLETIYTFTNTGATGSVKWFHDPLGRGNPGFDRKIEPEGTAIPSTKLKFVVPFVTQL